MTVEYLSKGIAPYDRRSYLNKSIRKDETIDKTREEISLNNHRVLATGISAIVGCLTSGILYKDHRIGLAVMSGLNSVLSAGFTMYLIKDNLSKQNKIKELETAKGKLETLIRGN